MYDMLQVQYYYDPSRLEFDIGGSITMVQSLFVSHISKTEEFIRTTIDM